MVIKKQKYLAFAILIGGRSSKFNTEKIRFKFDNKSLVLHLIGSPLGF